MARLEDLIKDIADPSLRSQIASEVGKLKSRKKFGLVFEEHLPEIVQLPGLAVKLGARVIKRRDTVSGFFVVTAPVNGKKVSIAPERGGPEEIAVKDELVVVKRFGEPMYPALVPVERVTRSPGKPYHTLINAENFHALQLLLYCYEGRVDVIYIDPPYNTGARDWKYNNDYVEAEDQWRHSKWLSMMKRRLLLAKRLLKPDSMMIVTIDEHEVHHLGNLLESIFPESTRQMATIVINAKGVSQGRLARVEEYALYVFMPRAFVPAHHDDLLSPDQVKSKPNQTPRWERLLRGGNNARRQDRPGLFYPIFVDPKSKRILEIGEALPLNKRPDLTNLETRKVAWPIRTDGSLGNYQLKPSTLRELLAQGFVRLGGFDKQRQTWTVLYLNKGTRKRIDNGEIRIVARDKVTGAIEIEYAGEEARKRNIKTVWHRGSHDSGIYGSSVLRTFVPDAKFAFPKSLYAVRDALGSVVRNRPDAIVLDFFAGSGTTLHATALLNSQDGGLRRCILVTNNEVEAELTKQLGESGLSPGMEKFERHGIAESVTWPRIKACLSGMLPDGSPIFGEYLDGRPMADGFEENAQYLKLNFLDPAEVKRGEMYEAILPILWMMAGASGDLELSKGSGNYHFPKGCPFCVLLREDHFKEFEAKLAARPDITHAFLVTDSVEAFYEMSSQVSKGKRCVQLYKSYLDNFKINLEPKNAD